MLCCSEIRTPIHGIIATAQLLETSSTLNQEQQDYIEIIGRSAKALLSIINSILDFSKIEAGRLELDPAPFDLRQVVNDAVKLLQIRCDAQHNTLSAIFAKDVAAAFIGDAGRIRQILINLLANACKFTINGFITIRVSVLKEGMPDKLRAKAALSEGKENECGIIRSHSIDSFKKVIKIAEPAAEINTPTPTTDVAASAVAASASALSAAHLADNAVAALTEVKAILASVPQQGPSKPESAKPAFSDEQASQQSSVGAEGIAGVAAAAGLPAASPPEPKVEQQDAVPAAEPLAPAAATPASAAPPAAQTPAAAKAPRASLPPAGAAPPPAMPPAGLGLPSPRRPLPGALPAEPPATPAAAAALTDVKAILASVQQQGPAKPESAKPAFSDEQASQQSSPPFAQPFAFAGKIVKLRIEVEDTGSGIDCKFSQTLFSPFSQADASSTRVHGGTGLGLAISERLVSLMKGTIGAHSVRGTGTIFWFDISLPVADEQSSPPSSSSPPLSAAPSTLMAVSLHLNDLISASGAAGTDPQLQHFVLQPPERSTPPSTQRQLTPSSAQDGQRDSAETVTKEEKIKIAQEASEEYRVKTKILIAEDNKVNQKVLTRMLERLGWTSEVANNGQEAIDKLQQDKDKDKRFQLILMDCQMPIKDGMQATADIRQLEKENPTRSRIWIIAVTADAVVGAADKYLKQGADDYLSKPFNLKDLQTVIEFACVSLQGRITRRC